MDNYNKILLLFQKLDDGSISDFEISELNNIIDSNSFDSSLINPNLDNQLTNINTDITGFNDLNTNEYLDNYLDKFYNNINDNLANVDSNLLNNTINNPVTNSVTNVVSNTVLLGSKFTPIIASISFMSIIAISYFTYNFINNTNKIDVKNEYVVENASNTNNIPEDISSNLVNDNINENNSKEEKSKEENKTNIENNLSISNEQNTTNIESINNESIKSESIKSKIIQLRKDKDLAVYNDEILSIFVQNNEEFNKILQNYTNKLKIAQKNNDYSNQIDILYKLAIIYRVKNISADKSIEILNKAISIIDNSKLNENEFNIIKSDLYGELSKSYKTIGNLAESNSALKKCLNSLNNQMTNSENKIVVNKKMKYWNDILNSQQ